MKVTIVYTYKDKIDEFDNVTNIKQTLYYRLGAEVVLKIDGKRNRVRIPAIDIKYMAIID